MDRANWMYKTTRSSSIYMMGVQKFLSVAEANRMNEGSGVIFCPCNVCKNFKSFDAIGIIEFHLVQNGFMPRYTCWSMHGESRLDQATSSMTMSTNNNERHLGDDDAQSHDPNANLNELLHDIETNIGDNEHEKLKHLFEDAEKPLYKGYLEGVESIGIPKTRHSGRLDGKGVIGKKAFIPTRDSLETAHLVVLKHMTCLTPYLDEHIDTLRATHPGKDKMWYVNTHNKELSSWLRRKVMETDTDETVNKLGQGPDFKVHSYQGFGNSNNNLLIYGKEISDKAKANAAKQTSVPRLGRSGWTGIEEKADFIWPILVEKYPLLDKMKNECSRLYIMGRAKRIKKSKRSETDSYELPLDAITMFGDLVRVEREMIADGSYLKEKDDPLVRVWGSEHGGRSRTVSEVIGATRVHDGLYKNGRKRARNDSGANVNFDTSSASPVNVSQPLHGASCESVGRIDYPPIELVLKLHIFLTTLAVKDVKDSFGFVEHDPIRLNHRIVANGVAWPTSDRVLHGNLIKEGCAKVHVDSIVDKYSEYSVFNVTITDEVQKVGDMLRSFIQWPRSALKLVNKETTSKSASASITTSSHGSLSHRSASPQINIDDFATTSCYRPHFEVVDTHLQFQPQGDMMQHQVDQGGLMNMLSNVYKFRSASQDQFELHAFEPEVSPESDFHPEPEFIDPNVAPALDFIDPDVAPALDSIRNRPRPVRELVDRLSAHVGNDYVIEVVSPNGMYPEPVDEDIPYSELLQIFLNAWLDVTVLHWFAIKHWSLLIVCPTYKSGYIIDSKRTGKNKNSYLLVSILEEVFRVRFNWHVVKFWNEEGNFPHSEIEDLVLRLMQEFINKVFEDPTR
ncbi:hypothetical protein SSX86_010675 [Deinandra increscens subsp. villosa]|uniref:Transposase n=1 Tax=Deinandra increscens subsp. villosa TaxID=3103831 RepID=A0AAP0H549_9ASTR